MIVSGHSVDDGTRCVHYDSALDVVAIRFRCCDRYYPCHTCHAESVDHEAQIWPSDEFDQFAVLCGHCKTELTIRAYLACDDRCPNCDAAFNPRCRAHRHLYFEV